jgi:hypothetical protein
MTTTRTIRRQIRFVVLGLYVPMVLAACSANEQILKSGKDSPTPINVQSQKSDLEEQLESLRTADFRFIFVIRRKDGHVLDTADKAVIRQNTVDMNRRVLADDDKAVLIGSNTVPFKESFEILASAYAIQDLSPEPVPVPLPTREQMPKPAKTKGQTQSPRNNV